MSRPVASLFLQVRSTYASRQFSRKKLRRDSKRRHDSNCHLAPVCIQRPDPVPIYFDRDRSPQHANGHNQTLLFADFNEKPLESGQRALRQPDPLSHLKKRMWFRHLGRPQPPFEWQ